MDGFGKLYYPNEKLAYEGEWKNNAFNGKGKVYNEEPVELAYSFDFTNFDYLQDHWDSYEGDFVNDYKEGHGTLILVNGEKYVGEFKQDMIHGRGTFYKITNENVEGEWSSNQLVSQH